MKFYRHVQRIRFSIKATGLALMFSAGVGSLVIGSNGAMAAGLANPFPAAENLSQDEITQISAAFEQALTDAKPGTVVVWKSADSGRSGQVRILRAWDATAGHCVEVEQRFSKGTKATYEVPYCKGQDGSWKVTF